MKYPISCDQCGARAYLYAFHKVKNISVLYFCGSHARKSKPPLNSSGWLLGLIGDSLSGSGKSKGAGSATSNELEEWLEELVDIRLV